MRRTLLALVSAATLAIALVGPATAITGNYVEDFDHPFVGLIAFYSDRQGTDDGFIHRCTGSLIDDGTPLDGSRVVVTAGHCTDDGNRGRRGRLGSNLVPPGRRDPLLRATAIRSPATRTSASMTRLWMTRSRMCATSHEMYNYGFDNFAGFPNNRDVGVVILDKPVILPEYGTITDAGAITSNKSVEVTVSGYGISDGHAASDPTVSFRERLMATSTVITSTDTWTAGYNLKTQNNGGNRGGTCSGDSGGPAFYPSTSNTIVAVTSFGRTGPNNDCQGRRLLLPARPAGSHRLDRPGLGQPLEPVIA